MGRVLLTSDKTLMSNYHNNEFLGFGTCAPSNIIPDLIYNYLFFPEVKSFEGVVDSAPYGLRKIEAKLLGEGFDVSTVSPKYLKQFIGKADVLGVYTMDPFGLGPASTTLAALFKKEPFLAKHFRGLFSINELVEAKKRGLKIIVGGPGAWQFKFRPKFVDFFGIDCVVEGEAENFVGNVFGDAIAGKKLPRFWEVKAKQIPKLEEIPDIVLPSINGLIEIGRGCCRGCEFCNVTLRPLRWVPIERIMREIEVNIKLGNEENICLHSEDVMLYGSKDIYTNKEKVLELHEKVVSKSKSLSWSHCSLAAVAANPVVFTKISQLIRTKQKWYGAEIGIETGSARLAEKIMPAKALPFKAEEWPEVVKQGMGLMHDNMMVPAGTLIVGLPEETEDDLLRTMELLDDLKDCRSLIVPLFFVPLGRLKNLDWFKHTSLTELHKQLLFKCAEHDFRWIDNLLDISFNRNWYGPALKEALRIFSYIARRKARQQRILEFEKPQ